jgi:hypothetical protein
MVILSYRRVFRVDRRIHRIDNWPIPVPGGIPLRGCIYFALVVLAVVIARQVPGPDVLLAALNAPLRYIVVPVFLAMLLTRYAPDGRRLDAHAITWMCYQYRAHRPHRTMRVGGHVRVRWDLAAPDFRRLLVYGPAQVHYRDPVRYALSWRGHFIARPHQDGTTDAYNVPAGERLEVKP